MTKLNNMIYSTLGVITLFLFLAGSIVEVYWPTIITVGTGLTLSLGALLFLLAARRRYAQILSERHAMKSRPCEMYDLKGDEIKAA